METEVSAVERMLLKALIAVGEAALAAAAVEIVKLVESMLNDR
jgi:hypothetical protein